MGSKRGFEYRYRFWEDDSIISRYNSQNRIRPEIKYLFENRSYFMVRRIDGMNEIIDSERYVDGAEDDMDESWLRGTMDMRLTDYWMSIDEIKDVARKAFAFCKEKAAADPQRGIIPIAIELEVCTVQQVGEQISDTIDRAIKSEYLYPSFLFYSDIFVDDDPNYNFDTDLVHFLRDGLETVRIEDVDKESLLMEKCPICSRTPKVGAEISILEDCHHTFHYHCIIGWLLKNNKSCPTCGHHISY